MHHSEMSIANMLCREADHSDCQCSSSANYSDGLIVKADSLKWDQSHGICDLGACANF